MTVKIGSKYLETKAMFRERIRKGNINSSVELESGNLDEDHSCYFCSRTIKGKLWRLIDKINENGDFKVYIDDRCYNRAKIFFYYDEIPFSFS